MYYKFDIKINHLYNTQYISMSSKATYKNSPQKRAIGRIIYDIKSINKSTEILGEENGLYFNFNNEDTINTRYKMLIIGPEDTPYVGGFYLFKAQFPDQYPFYPMTMKSITQGGGVRKHPNLYISGKCCFSFLGTWSGPPWTACQNPQTVGISMRSVLTNNPLTNEPGWVGKDDERTKLYEIIIRYFNIRYGVIGVIDNPPSHFDYFKDIIKYNFVKYYNHYLNELPKFEQYKNKTIKSPAYGFSITIDYDYVKNRLNQLFKELSKQLTIKCDKTTDDSINNTPNNTITPVIKYIRKSPVDKASKYDEGTIKDGKDGKKWIVRKFDSGRMQWIRCK